MIWHEAVRQNRKRLPGGSSRYFFNRLIIRAGKVKTGRRCAAQNVSEYR